MLFVVFNCELQSNTTTMKNKIILASFLLGLAFAGCKKDNYPGGQVAPYIAIYDVRNIHKGTDVTLTSENMFGSTKISAVVISDHSGKNMPEGLLIVQDRRRLNELRGIGIELGPEAATYVPGDSVIIDVEGALLKKTNGNLRLTGITNSKITKISSGVSIPLNRVTTSAIIKNPMKYEATLLVIVKGGFNPLPAPTDVLAGEKVLNDGFGQFTLRTEAAATFANDPAPILANFYGIIFNKMIGDSTAPTLRLRKGSDVVPLSSTIEVPPLLISGFMSDVVLGTGNDANYEYIQLIATKDIDFSVTPFSLVTTNNANASTPTGFPANGWATGGIRTYKFTINSGTVTKGNFCYVGGTAKLINGIASTNISAANWVKAFNYSTTAGEGFGTATTNLLANSGNAFGMAVFEGATVNVSTKPADVVFIATGGSLFTAGPPALGYRICNNDFYDVKNPITLVDQPFYRQGDNTLSFAYNTADLGIFNTLGGVFNTTLGRWTQARAQVNVMLTKTSLLSEIESAQSTKIEQ